MSKGFIFTLIAILSIVGIGALAVIYLNHKSDTDAKYGDISPANMKLLAQGWKEAKKFKAALFALVPLDSRFSNAVAVLGSGFTVTTNHRDSTFTATFPPREIPGLTNRYIISLDVRNDIVLGIGTSRLNN
jgi:hypothetical protein